jgi:hypothetical protein
MALRGLVRDLLSLYLGFEVIRGYVTGTMYVTNISIAALVLFGLALWFMLERIGLLPKV